MTAVKDWLIENDPGYAALHADMKRMVDIPKIATANSISQIKLKLFQGTGKYSGWNISWYEGKNQCDTAGQRSWLPKANTSEVKQIWDEIQTDFMLQKVQRMAYRDMAIEDGNPYILWQVIWIEPRVYSDSDKLIRTKPTEAYVIYNNEKLWHTKAMTKGKILEFNFTQPGIHL
jgi:hypothetical protein